MEPAEFLHHFAVYGPVTGAAVFPFDLASTVVVAITTYSAVESHRPGRRAWTLATVGMVGTLLVLPIYFVDANLAMLDPAIPPEAVHTTLTAWYRWNWVRAGLGPASAASACIALIVGRGESSSVPETITPK
ncbi:hypothetical protein MPY17_21020 [Rhodococcus opacus]|uniref:hypothetical protein n=1 Tax=Rhodococcus opacus TaxID=37919 RepID=UPI001FF57F55|nr:hypothetical protein [Rhodococcus opacus]UOT01480.1 hypothetical protein MPY17_21020 [Rhodococcus opacus]